MKTIPALLVGLGALAAVGLVVIGSRLLGEPEISGRDRRAGTEVAKVGNRPIRVFPIPAKIAVPSTGRPDSAGVGIPEAPSASDAADSGAHDGRCLIATVGDSPIVRACAEGGIEQAKREMKRLVAAAKVNGTRFACDSCHKEGKTEHDLLGDAREQFKKLLAAAIP
jgi:hypothetical protein